MVVNSNNEVCCKSIMQALKLCFSCVTATINSSITPFEGGLSSNLIGPGQFSRPVKLLSTASLPEKTSWDRRDNNYTRVCCTPFP